MIGHHSQAVTGSRTNADGPRIGGSSEGVLRRARRGVAALPHRGTRDTRSLAAISSAYRGGCCTNRSANRCVNQSWDNRSRADAHGCLSWDEALDRAGFPRLRPTVVPASSLQLFTQQPPRSAAVRSSHPATVAASYAHEPAAGRSSPASRRGRPISAAGSPPPGQPRPPGRALPARAVRGIARRRGSSG